MPKLKLNLREAAISIAANTSNAYYKPNRPTRKRMSALRRQVRGFSKISVVLDAAFNKMTSGSPSVHESLRRLFQRVMQLKAPHEMHSRLEISGKKNWVPQRYLLVPPKAKGQVHGKAHTALGNRESARFDEAAQKVARAFGNDSAEQSRLQNLLQIFSHYSSLQANGYRTFGLEDFQKLIEDANLAKFTEYRASDLALCWRAFSRSKTGASNPKTMTRRLNFEAFVEGFPLIASFVFRTSSRPPNELSEELLEEHILPRAQRVRSDPLTLALLWNEDAQRTIQEYSWPLQIIFRHFASLYKDAISTEIDDTQNRKEKQNNSWSDPISKGLAKKRRTMKEWSSPLSGDDTMDWQEFLKMLQCFQVVGSRADQLDERNARKIFNEANLSEISDTDVDRLSWHEYVEALGRCALQLFPLNDPDLNQKFELNKEQVHFQPLAGMRLTHGLKNAVKTVFKSSSIIGRECFAPKGQPIVRQLSPRATRMVERGWRLRRQEPVGVFPWVALGKPSQDNPWEGTLVHSARRRNLATNVKKGLSRKSRFAAETKSKVDDHMSATTMRLTRAHKHDYVHERGLHDGQGPDLAHVKTKVDDHMSATTMRLTHAHKHDYVHERGLHDGQGPDLAHVKTKVEDHMSATTMRLTRAHKHDYVHERGLRKGKRPDILHAKPKADDHMPATMTQSTNQRNPQLYH